MSGPADPCAYVPLSKYDWEIVPLLSGRRGACNGITLAWNPTVVCLFVALHAVAVWTALGVNVQAAIMFKRWSTVYFWSIILTACANIVQTITTDLMLFTTFGDMLVLDSVLFPISDLLSGFGFLLVLWSRLHLVMDCPKMLKVLLVLIVIIALPLRIVIVLSAIGPPPDRHQPRWGIHVWQVMYRLEMLIPVLDICLACLYIYLFATRFRSTSNGSKSFRRSFWLLVIGEVFVIAGDASIMGVWFAGVFLIRWATGPFLYSLKLLVEFLILNSLTSMRGHSFELRHISTTVSDEEAVIPHTNAEVAREKNQLFREDENGAQHCEVVKDGSASEQVTEAIDGQDKETTILEKISSLDAWERRYLGR